MKKIITFFIVLASLSFSQSFHYSESIGKFNRAFSFYITANGLIYVTDISKDEVFMLDTLGNVLKNFGGYGWDENSFDDPVDVYADPLTIYVTDKNNHRIKKFDKNLNYISSLFTRDSDDFAQSFGYPLSCSISNQGDLYLIDSDNKRILKFDIFGKFIQNFGGFDAGNFMLKNPTQLAIASNNNVFIADDNRVIVFDQYGNGVLKINMETSVNSIRILFDQLTITSSKEIFYSNLRVPDAKLAALTIEGIDQLPKIQSAIIFNNKLYVLTEKALLTFIRKSKN
jgi:DNA-binding beta-propeller fold protein YncE